MSAISAEQQGLAQEMTELSPGHDSDPICSAKRIHLTITDRERDSLSEDKRHLNGSFAAEIRTSGDENSPPDFIIKGKSRDLYGGEADVSVTDKSGEVVMTMTRPPRHTMMMLGNENATVKFASGHSQSASYSGKGRALTFNGTPYSFDTTNKCTQCYYICCAFLCFFPTLGTGSCYMLNKMSKATSTAEFKQEGQKIADFNMWFFAQPFKPDEECCVSLCGNSEKFDTLLDVDVHGSPHATWSVDSKWAMFIMAVATAMDTQLEPPAQSGGSGGP